jgi:DNA replication protein DnaC
VLDRENFSTFNIEIFSDDYSEEYKTTPKQNMLAVYNTCLNFVDQFSAKNHQNLLFYGKTGLGKTFLCNCIAKSLLDSGYTVIYQTSFRIIDIISNYRFSSKKTDEMRFKYNMLLNCDLLIIDDLGTEMINSFSTTEIFNIINTRLLENKKTIISTNFTLEQLRENYLDRITSRLFGQYELIRFIGKDLRW